jgi:hypothetical protein
MAPEMVTAPHSAGSASDVYSAAITLIIMLTGKKSDHTWWPEVCPVVPRPFVMIDPDASV